VAFLARTELYRVQKDKQRQGLENFPKVHWSRKHQESTGPEKFSTGPGYRNGGNKIC
jgi:hypothetical protein